MIAFANDLEKISATKMHVDQAREYREGCLIRAQNGSDALAIFQLMRWNAGRRAVLGSTAITFGSALRATDGRCDRRLAFRATRPRDVSRALRARRRCAALRTARKRNGCPTCGATRRRDGARALLRALRRATLRAVWGRNKRPACGATRRGDGGRTLRSNRRRAILRAAWRRNGHSTCGATRRRDGGRALRSAW
jgi:hypothetical protein